MSSRIVAPSPYVGRFAPTPSGPLHLGSLVTAVASWWHARRVGGRWLLRIDDLDRQRCPPTAADRIKRQLSHCGLHWDGSAVHQRERIDHYRQGLQQLLAKGHVFPCNCTRAALRQRGPAGAAPYDGHCLQFPPTSGPLSLRFQPLPGAPVRFIDGQFGMQQRARQNCVGFPLWRVDDVPAYALAGAVDEAHLGVTEAVRGDDLLEETFSQLLVMDAHRDGVTCRWCAARTAVSCPSRTMQPRSPRPRPLRSRQCGKPWRGLGGRFRPIWQQRRLPSSWPGH